MIALSIRQPWAWLIVSRLKKVENRTWPTKVRGWFAIHAGKTVPSEDEIRAIEREFAVVINRGELRYGGLVGTGWLADCVTAHPSKYFEGPFGFVIHKAEPIPLIPCRGFQGFFNAHDGIIAEMVNKVLTNPGESD